MPRLPVVSGQDIVSALERLGFERVRPRGSHVVMRRGDTVCSVPMHREIKKGTFAAIIRQAGIAMGFNEMIVVLITLVASAAFLGTWMRRDRDDEAFGHPSLG